MPEIDNSHSDIEQAGGEEPQASDAVISEPGQEEPAGDDLIEDSVTGGEFSAELAAEPIPVAEAGDSKHWYIIHTYSGFERKVAESLRTRAEAFGFSEQIGQILIPEEEVVELRNGKSHQQAAAVSGLRRRPDGNERRVVAPGEGYAASHRIRGRRADPGAPERR